MFRPGAPRRPRPLTPSASNSSGPGPPKSGTAPVRAKKPPPKSSLSSEPPPKRSRVTPISQGPAASKDADRDEILYFAALYTKKNRKKNKTFQDGFVSIRNDRILILMNETGKQLAKSSARTPIGGLKEGNTLEINSFEMEVDRPIAEDDFTSGRIFMPGGKSLQGGLEVAQKSASSGAASRRFKVPRGPGNPSTATRVLRPVHDPEAPGAVVVMDSFKHATGRVTVPIVIDPYLSKHMRPHQKEGVKYLYSCVEGKGKGRDDNSGVVLADEMGLGKSLQSIALMWTMLKQGSLGTPVAEKAIIVCPASLVGNWAAEIKKWLGDERLKPLEVMSGQSKSYKGVEPIYDFVRGKVSRVLIISYEMFRNYAEDLYACPCGLIICDEGHRLKSSAGNKTIDALMKIPCRRRIILTGTPVQNDLEEFFAMCNFVNPGALSSLTTFKSVFAQPILKSRDTSATKEEVAIGVERGEELNRIASKFLLRRTSETLEKYLPPKTETVVFCRLTPSQQAAYEAQCEEGFASLGKSSPGAAFSTIMKLRKICCHPAMLNAPDDEKRSKSASLASADVSLSGKIQVAMSLVSASVACGDRVVLVSNFTSTLDILQLGLKELGIIFLRLNGSTPAKSRMDLVKTFNVGRQGETVFLLSAKAGGVGLNLIGANRLILFDPDWNPATDLQTMGRVWRDGQKKEVFVYRLLCTGSIEEKIYQRQLFKGELQLALACSDAVKPSKRGKKSAKAAAQPGGSANFSADELRDLFKFKRDILFCDTLDVLGRSRNEESSHLLEEFIAYRDHVTRAKGKDMEEGRTDQDCDDFVFCGMDVVLAAAVNENAATRGIVSYLFSKETGKTLPSFLVPGEASSEDDLKDEYDVSDGDNSSGEESGDDNQNHVSAKKALPSTKKRRPIEQSPDADSGDDFVDLLKTKPSLGARRAASSPDKENEVPPTAKAWDAAVDELDIDGDHF